jgi:hypothetical protein
LVQEHTICQQLARMLKKRAQESEFCRRQVHGPPLCCDLSLFKIDLEIAAPEDRLRTAARVR